jgi:asparagine synthase (glutamine-hydrolysing)
VCGLLAIHSPDQPVRPEVLGRGLAQIAHRGPDGQRVWIAPDGRVGLGHARLRVIDLVTGDQPLVSEDGRLHLIVNGEFYDYERIRRDLDRRGHALRTRSDSEIALHLYEELGTDCLTHLRGEFAFVLWDERSSRLFAARDRIGAKPLLYAWLGDTLYLASEAKALFAAGVPARWDEEAFFQHCHIFVDQDRTIFAGVRQVPPGHYLLAEGKKVWITRYWDFDYPLVDDAAVCWTEAEATEAVREGIETAVRLRLRADVPVGCYLSGGLDSSTILGLAAEQSAGPVDVFTARFDEDPEDETPIAEQTANHFGARLRPVRLSEETLADNFADAVWHAESVVPNMNAVAKYLLSRAARAAGCPVVLTGEGADEIFGGYAFIHRDMLLSGSPCLNGARDAALRRIDGGFGVPRLGAPELPTGGVRDLLGFVPSIVSTYAQSAVYQRALLQDWFLARFANRDAYGEFVGRLDVPGQLAGREPIHQSMYLLCKSMLPNYLLGQLGDRMELANGVEGRLPFLDHRLIELARTLPGWLKINGAVEKHILREAARPFITSTVYARRKKVFWSPSGLGRSTQTYQLLQDTLRGPVLASLPFYDRRGVLRLLDAAPDIAQYPGAATGVAMLLVSIASACVLHERFGL